MRISTRIGCAACAVFLFVGAQALGAEKVFDKRFAVTPGGTLTLETDGGSIVVTGSDTREVVVHAVINGSESQTRNFEFSADTDDRGVTVHGRRNNDWWLDFSWFFGNGVRIKFDVQVPREYRLDLRTAGGSIDTRNIKGSVFGHTSGGSVRLNAVSGDIDMSTSGGSIRAEQLNGKASLRTSGGTISATDANGDLDVRTSGGSIRLHNIDGSVSARTSGGSIELALRGANRGATLRTSGGSIRVTVPKDFKARLDAHTSGGGVHCDLPVMTLGDDDRRHKELRGDINGGGPTLSAHTSGGSIWIRAQE